MPDLDCPSGAELKAFVLGELPHARADAVRVHLDGCARRAQPRPGRAGPSARR